MANGQGQAENSETQLRSVKLGKRYSFRKNMHP